MSFQKYGLSTASHPISISKPFDSLFLRRPAWLCAGDEKEILHKSSETSFTHENESVILKSNSVFRVFGLDSASDLQLGRNINHLCLAQLGMDLYSIIRCILFCHSSISLDCWSRMDCVPVCSESRRCRQSHSVCEMAHSAQPFIFLHVSNAHASRLV